MQLLKVFLLFTHIYRTIAVGNETFPDYITEQEFANIEKAGLTIQFSNSSVLELPPINESVLITRPGFGSKLWPIGIVPYTIDRTFSQAQRDEIALAIKEYHDNTCIRFVPRTQDHPNWLKIVRDIFVCAKAERCMVGGSQTARFGGSCVKSGTIVHQLGHTLCMSHEETRQDRDKWIGFNKFCLAPKIDGPDYTTGLNKLYDYLSVEHHEKECKTKCYKPKQPGVTKCGSGGVLSVLDIEILNEVYNCNEGCMGYRFVNILNIDASTNLVLFGGDLNATPLFFCRAYHQGDIIPGKFYRATNECFVAWGGLEHKKTEDVEVLTALPGFQLQLILNTGTLPPNTLRGGRNNARETLYIISCEYGLDGKFGFFPGKFHPSAGAFFSYEGKELKCDIFFYVTCVL